jgi:crotonobetainyl-CoA:carnitine CoA-transferase CaiB-like acyl-CoA transferase
LSGAVATLAALYNQRITGMGQHIDVSKQEAIMDFHRVWVAQYPNEGTNPTRLARRDGFGWSMPCKDGWMVIATNEEHQWVALVKLMGDPEWARDERYREAQYRAHHLEEIEPHVSEWMMNHTQEEIYHRGQALGLTVSPVTSAEEVVNSRQLEARGFFVEVNHPEAGKIKQPSVPYQLSETPWALDRPAPLLGQHNEEIYCQRLGYSKQDLVKLREAGII